MKYWNMFPCEVNEKTISDLIIDLFRQHYNSPDTEFTLYISSKGGDIDSAIRFYDFIKAAGLKINTVGFGQVDSAAVILFLCGKKRTLIENCRVRLHQPTYNGVQQSQVIDIHKETLSLLEELDKRYFDILTNELHKNPEEFKKLLIKGEILKPNKAKEFGIATNIEKSLPIDR